MDQSGLSQVGTSLCLYVASLLWCNHTHSSHTVYPATFSKHVGVYGVWLYCDYLWVFWVSSGPGDEAKLFLWWHKALNLSAEQLQPQSGQTEVSGVVMGLQKLETRLLQLGEERLNSGLLGAIGLGKRSPVSNRYIHAHYIAKLM